MLVSKFIDAFRALETNSVMGGLTYLEIVQSVLDDIFSDDSFLRLYQPSPYIVTVDNQLTYDYNEILSNTPFIDDEGNTAIRRMRGIFDPALSPTDAEIQDYYRGFVPDFDQRDIHTRVYNGNINVDNERKRISFDSNPGDTTTQWKADIYLLPPRVIETDQVPLLAGWERKLLLPGCRAWFEELDAGRAGLQSSLFETRKVEYRDALERESRLDNKTTEKGFQVRNVFVRPQ